MAKKHLVFVYGTLRKGFWNHYLMDGAEFIGTATTHEKYALYACIIPYAYQHEGISRIVGELYEVDSRQLEILDELEDHPDTYRREQIPVASNGKSYIAWLYFYPEKVGTVIENGDYLEWFGQGVPC